MLCWQLHSMASASTHAYAHAAHMSMHMSVHVCIHTYTHAYAHVEANVHRHVRTHVRTRAHAHAHMHMFTCKSAGISSLFFRRRLFIEYWQSQYVSNYNRAVSVVSNMWLQHRQVQVHCSVAARHHPLYSRVCSYGLYSYGLYSYASLPEGTRMHACLHTC